MPKPYRVSHPRVSDEDHFTDGPQHLGSGATLVGSSIQGSTSFCLVESSDSADLQGPCEQCCLGQQD
jgi:hypothetical protein